MATIIKNNNHKYNYFYKITNNINNHFYYGVHCTEKLDDGYMGSGSRLRLAYKKYGIENFSKEILKFFDTAQEAYEYEAEVVNEVLVKQSNCYNVQTGGLGFNASNLVTVKGKNTDHYFLIHRDEYYNNKDKYTTAWQGRTHKLESRNKIRKTMTPLNSTNSRVWVSKNGITKYLAKIYLDEYLNDGWELGRKGYKPRKNCQGKKI